MIKEAEHLKASFTRPSGKSRADLMYVHECDDAYFHYTSHVDKQTREKIKRGEFVELEKLLPKYKFKKRQNGETKLEIIGKDDGQSFLVPLSERPNNDTVSSFRQWDRAFRVYSGIYSKANPDRAEELHQYINSIETASETFAWDNVYAYDEVFRNLMEEFPRRPWGMICQQAWSLIPRDPAPKQNGGNSFKKSGFKRKDGDTEICYRFNKGRCSFGTSSRYYHRCSHRNKSGHAMNVCRKRDKDKKAKERSETASD